MNNLFSSSASIRGLAYPLRVENGNLMTRTDGDLKSQEIRSVIETRFFERVMRADYGTNDYTLEVLDPGLINSELQNSVSENVSGLSSLVVEGDWLSQGDDGVYKIRVTFSINGKIQPPVNFSLSS